jgi:predicted glycoside hydrolase/deacetylase ChbG (UPF0249 family)
MNSLIVNADDLGMTPGTNKAIFEGFDHGTITHSSIMANADYFSEATEGIKRRKALNIGIHLNLTYGKALHYDRTYNDEAGFFNMGFSSIFIKSIYDKAFLRAVEKEFESQILRVLRSGIAVTHVDSHRHIHLIPGIYKIVVELSAKYNINRIRLVNENFLESVSMTRAYDFLSNGGLVKFILLKILSTLDAKKFNSRPGTKLYSVLYTGTVRKKTLQKLRLSKQCYEVMIHPGLPELDKEVVFHDEGEKRYRLSQARESEYRAVL